jgi:hypothetical protein
MEETKMTKRGGRKHKPGKREPNGRMSRDPAQVAARLKDGLDAEQRETIGVAIAARERVFHESLDPKHSRDQLAGSAVGRWCLKGKISRAQYDAAMTWLEDSRNYEFAVSGAVGKSPAAVNLNATKGASGRDNVVWTRRCVRRYRAAQSAVQEAQNSLRLAATLPARCNTS